MPALPHLSALPGRRALGRDGDAALCLSGHSHGEALAARFVLGVWNPTTNWEEVAREARLITDPDGHIPPFDIYEAIRTWDENHRSALLTWVSAPFWP